jgi:hypothetical protein
MMSVQTGQASVIIEDLVQKVDQQVKQDRCFTISSLSNEYPRVSHSVLSDAE